MPVSTVQPAIPAQKVQYPSGRPDFVSSGSPSTHLLNTIVRATHFFEFVGGIAELASDGHTVRLPPALMQPIAADDVAAALAEVATAEAKSLVRPAANVWNSPGVASAVQKSRIPAQIFSP
jgi:hypothetical protein